MPLDHTKELEELDLVLLVWLSLEHHNLLQREKGKIRGRENSKVERVEVPEQEKE